MTHFSSPTLARNQRILIPTALDDVIPAEHQVRIFDEIMAQIDWQPWEARDTSKRGRPPIPPRVMASVILYGLQRRTEK